MPIRIREGKSGKKYQAWYRHRGSRFSKYFLRRAEAQVWLQSELESLTRGRGVKVKADLTLSDFCQTWLPRYKVDVKNCTFVNAESFLQNWILPALGNLSLDEITDHDLITFRGKILDRGRSRRTANYALAIVSKMFNDAADPAMAWNLKLMNPAASVKPLALELKQVPYWEKDEVQKFLNAVEKHYPRDLALYSLLLNTGLRVGEACALHWDQVDFARECIHVRRNVDWMRMRVERTTKNHELRVVGVVSELLPVLKAQHLKLGRPGLDQLVFPNEAGHLKSLTNLHSRSFQPCIKFAKVREITIHDLRHTFAAHYVMNGGKIYDLKKILGHRNISMTERYAHLSQEYIQRQTGLVGFASSAILVAK